MEHKANKGSLGLRMAKIKAKAPNTEIKMTFLVRVL